MSIILSSCNTLCRVQRAVAGLIHSRACIPPSIQIAGLLPHPPRQIFKILRSLPSKDCPIVQGSPGGHDKLPKKNFHRLLFSVPLKSVSPPGPTFQQNQCMSRNECSRHSESQATSASPLALS